MINQQRTATSSTDWRGQRIHFIGIGGSGMNGLARLLVESGAQVSGSDTSLSPALTELANLKVRISPIQNGNLITPETQLVVYTAAVGKDNPEYKKATELGIECIKYAQMLGRVMASRDAIGISGTHGKTTTSSMTALGLRGCGLKPGFVIGAASDQLDSRSSCLGEGPLVVESCEYDRSFHNLRPTIAVINNIEADHLDYYKGGLPEIIQSFREFAALVPANGQIFVPASDANAIEAVRGMESRTTFTGLEIDEPVCDREAFLAGWVARDICQVHGLIQADVYFAQQWMAQLRLSVPGIHNLRNAVMALAACYAVGGDVTECAKAISAYTGAERRMTEVGKFKGALIIDDYGHHPTEIRATLSALQARYKPNRLLCIFQPHQCSRTRLLFEDFTTSFSNADLVLIPEIFAARDSEADRKAMTGQVLVDGLVAKGVNAKFIPDFGQIRDYIHQVVGEGDIVLTLGAGTVWKVGRDILAQNIAAA